MSLPPEMLDGVVRISSAGDLIGSGCLIAVASETIPGHHWSYVVTAHHVVDKQVPIEVQAPDADYRDKPNPDSYWSLHPAVEVSDWRQPLDGVDLAIAPFFGRPGEADAVLAFRLEDQVLEDRYGPDLAGPIYYTGMFSPERGVEVPMARTGTVGVMNVPDLRSDYEGFTHLVDCRSYEGFSGSPCFTQRVFAEVDRVLDPPPVAPSEARRDDGSVPEYAALSRLTRLCGIFVAHYDYGEGGRDAISRFGVGVMVRHHEIRAALMTGEAKVERRDWDEQLRELQRAGDRA